MTLEIIVFGIAAVLCVLLIVCLINADECEKHDDRVRMRWADARESEPPEWADPERWWESEGKS